MQQGFYFWCMSYNDIWYAIYTVLATSAISSAVLAYQKKRYRYYAIFSVLCIYIILTENYADFLLKRKLSITSLYNVEPVVEFTTLIIIQVIICKQKIIKKIMFLSAITFCTFSICYFLFFFDIKKEQSLTFNIGCISTIFCCFYNLAYMLFSLNDVPLTKQPNLLHSLAIVIFYGTTFIMHSSYSFLIGLPRDFLINITIFLYIIYAATYFIHTWAFCSQINFKKLLPKWLIVYFFKSN